jgi:hypothetical protein
MTRNVKKIVRQIVGIALLVLGVVGLALPVLQGWLTIFAGLYVLFPEDTPTGKKIRDYVRRRRRDLAGQLEKRRDSRSRGEDRERRRRQRRPF